MIKSSISDKGLNTFKKFIDNFEKSLVLYENKYDIDEIKKHCEKYLPKYMIPKYFLDSSNMKRINKKI